METDEDALNTLDDIVQSMEKEIATTKVIMCPPSPTRYPLKR